MAKFRSDEDAFEEKPRPRPSPRRNRDDDEDNKQRRRSRDEDDDSEEQPRTNRGSSRRQDRNERDRDDFENGRRRPAKEGSALIPTQNVFALLGYYFGFGALIVILGTVALFLYDPVFLKIKPVVHLALFGFAGLIALCAATFGIVGMVKASQNPRVKGKAHAIIGMILGLAEIVALVILILLGFAMRKPF